MGSNQQKRTLNTLERECILISYILIQKEKKSCGTLQDFVSFKCNKDYKQIHVTIVNKYIISIFKHLQEKGCFGLFEEKGSGQDLKVHPVVVRPKRTVMS